MLCKTHKCIFYYFKSCYSQTKILVEKLSNKQLNNIITKRKKYLTAYSASLCFENNFRCLNCLLWVVLFSLQYVVDGWHFNGDNIVAKCLTCHLLK